MINAIQIALSGLNAAAKKAEGAASNIANLTTSGSLSDPASPPYSSVTTVQQAQAASDGSGQGIKATNIPKTTPFVPAYSPDSPFADSEGYIGVPNTNLAEEAVNLNLAETTYKANLKVLQTASDLSKELLSVLDEDA